MRVPNPWKTALGFLLPNRGRPERTKFSLGERPIHGQMPPDESEAPPRRSQLSKELDRNIRELKSIFHVPESSDVVFRELVCDKPRVRIAIGYIEGLASFDKVLKSVLQPLMLFSAVREHQEKDPLRQLADALLPNGQVEEKNTLDQAVLSMISGDTVVFVDGQDRCLAVETKGWEHRTVEQALTERIVRGPQLGFTEVLRVNTALLRAMVRSPDLVIENVDVGLLAKTQCALVYMCNIASPKIVAEMRRRLSSIATDSILTSGQLEQYIEDHHALIPTLTSTERPDRVAAYVLEGAVAVLVSGDPFAIIAPTTIFSLIHSPEDYYVRWPYGTWLRYIRTSALLLAILLPGFYVAIVNYNPELIPTVLMIAIAASREAVPVPLAAETLLMYFGFELIREAGIRIPSPIGPTIGIVGALLIGEAAVSASLVSPIMVMIIAVTAVAAFTISNQEATMFIRVATLLFIIAGTVLGLLGIVSLLYILLSHAFALTSLGVPFFSPVSPRREGSGDTVYLAPPWRKQERPQFLRPKKLERQQEEPRLWDQGLTVQSTTQVKTKGDKKPQE